MKTILTCLIGCFICLGGVLADSTTDIAGQGNAALGLTTEENEYIESVVDYATKKPSVAKELFLQIVEKAGQNSKKGQSSLSKEDIVWVTQHADYWGHQNGYYCKHHLNPKCDPSGVPVLARIDDNKQCDFNWFWVSLWLWYGWSKWEPIKDQIKDNFFNAWDRGYTENK
jgi:hypothetical protein